jgi:hypothetical protein
VVFFPPSSSLFWLNKYSYVVGFGEREGGKEILESLFNEDVSKLAVSLLGVVRF